MKNLLLLVLVSTFGYAGLQAQCDTTSIIAAGLPWSPTPVVENLSAGAVGVPYSDAVAAFLPDTLELDPAAIIGIPLPIPLPPFAFPTESQSMSAGTMPAGLTATFAPSGMVNVGEAACINISGTPTDASVTSVTINVVYTIRITEDFLALIPIPVPGLDTGLVTIPAPIPYQWNMDIASGVEEDLNLDRFEVAQNVPNPTRNLTTIHFTSPTAAKVGVSVYNIIGNEVFTSSIHADAGKNAYELSTSGFTPGIYFYSLNNGDAVVTKRMVVIK